jgi:hypothetical protein
MSAAPAAAAPGVKNRHLYAIDFPAQILRDAWSPACITKYGRRYAER